MLEYWTAMNSLPTPEGRKQAFAKMQQYVLDQVYTVPLGSLTKVQAVRSNVKGYRAVSHSPHCRTSGSSTDRRPSQRLVERAVAGQDRRAVPTNTRANRQSASTADAKNLAGNAYVTIRDV